MEYGALGSCPMKLEAGDWLVLAVCALDVSAAVCYAIKQRWLEVVVWVAYGVATIALLLLALKGRH